MKVRVCPRCKSPLPTGKTESPQPFCRKCCVFIGRSSTTTIASGSGEIVLPYTLTKAQQAAGQKLLENYQNHQDTLVEAVCGAGKTEITYPVISACLMAKQRVCFAIPRRDVVTEIAQRLTEHFPNAQVDAVYGGHSEAIEGDIIVCTTHQLYRFANCFGLLIIDEIDAFPFAGDPVLKAFAEQAAPRRIYLSATPPSAFNEACAAGTLAKINLVRRHHRFRLDIPRCIPVPAILMAWVALFLLRRMRKKGQVVFLYAPTIALATKYYNFLRHFCQSISLVHSKIPQRNERISAFRDGKLKILVTTSVLERGVTLKGLQVIVLNANHPLFTAAVLEQIAGRVGRKSDDPTGRIYFLGFPTPAMKTAIARIENANASMSDLPTFLPE